MMNGYKKYDRVKYIGNQSDNYFYPQYGTHGSVITAKEKEYIEVKWDGDLYGDKTWYCEYEDIEKIDCECPYCAEYSQPIMNRDDLRARLRNKTLEIKSKMGIELKIVLEHCPKCGKALVKK